MEALRKVRLKSAATVLAAGAVVSCLLFDTAPALGARRHRSQEVYRIGDSVRYQADGLAYEVTDGYKDTLLLRRGDNLVYAVKSEIVKVK